MEGDHGLAAFPDLVQRLLHDLIDLQGVDGQARKARQRPSRSPGILVERVRLGPRRLNFVALIDHFPVADRLRPAHEGLNVERRIEYLLDQRREPVHDVLVARHPLVVRKTDLELQIGEIVVSADVNAVFRQHVGEAFLSGLAAGRQPRENLVQPAAFRVRQQRAVKLGSGDVPQRGRGREYDVMPAYSVDHRANCLPRVGFRIQGIVAFVEDQQRVFIQRRARPLLARRIASPVELAVVRENDVAFVRPEAAREDALPGRRRFRFVHC